MASVTMILLDPNGEISSLLLFLKHGMHGIATVY